MPVFRWDIDKTYLETDFQSLGGLWKAATEEAEEKISSDGVVSLVQNLQHLDQSYLIFLSGSPIQMKKVLLEKFALDGIEVDEIILKDTVGAISKGRFSDVRNQFGHKLPQLLWSREKIQAADFAGTEYLFGDDVELDALIYLTYKMILDGRLLWKDVRKISKKMSVYPKVIAEMERRFSKVECSQAVQRIFIRLTTHVQPKWMQSLLPEVTPIHSWIQVACVLFIDGVLDWSAVQAVISDEGASADMVANLIQDLGMRHVLSREQLTCLLDRLGEARFVQFEETPHDALKLIEFSQLMNILEEVA